MSRYITAVLFGLFFLAQTHAQELTPVRIGWQVPWAVQGQLVQVMKHTDILRSNGIKATFVGRTYGPELNEAALSGEVDVVLTADQPAAILFSRNKGWKAIGRLMYNRTTTYVPPNSPVKSVGDLRGKTVGVPFGAAAERVLVEALHKAGLDPKKDVRVVNLGMLEHSPLIRKSGGKDTVQWDQFDALSGFDPIPAILESRNLVRTVDVGRVVSLVLMREDFIAQYPGIAKRFMATLTDAYDYYRQNVAQADQWFLQEAKLSDADNKACALAASLEPNLRASTRAEIRVSFTEDDLVLMQKGADFIAPVINKRINMRDFVLTP